MRRPTLAVRCRKAVRRAGDGEPSADQFVDRIAQPRVLLGLARDFIIDAGQ
jgi:hypothetical protein